MAFYIVMLGLLVGAFYSRRAVTKESESKNEGWAVAITIVIVGGLAAMLILGGIGGTTAYMADRKLVSTETHTVAEGSPFEMKDNSIEFVEKKTNGSLVPHNLRYSELKYETLDIKTVEVQEYEIYHYNVFPWVWGPSYTVTIK